MIELRKVSKVYDDGAAVCRALQEVDLTIEKGEMTAIIGASGSGKSTLLNVLGAMDSVSEGQYLLNGKNIEEYSEKQMARLRNEMFGFVVQDFALIERYTVEKNVMLPLYYSKKHKKNKKQRVEEVLKSLGIWEKREELVRCLSGGQRQRVAIARALVNEAEIILADEPTGALDQATGREVMDLFEEIHNEGKTIILVTHDQKIADRCQRVIEIADGTIKSDR